MTTNIAEYYLDELIKWNKLIGFYNQELDDFEIKLAEIIQRNTIPGIAAKVEAQQDKLNAISHKFYSLQDKILQQESTLKSDHEFISDTLINTEIEKQQSDIRQNMKQLEKEYIDIKYDCYNFLSGTLKKRND